MSPYCCLYTLYMAYIWPYMAYGLRQNFENFPLPFRPRPTSAGSPDLLARGRGREWWGKFRRPTLDRQRSSKSDCIVCIVVVGTACCTRQASFRTVKFTGRKDACLGGRGENCGANSEKIIDFEERNGRLHGTTEGLRATIILACF